MRHYGPQWSGDSHLLWDGRIDDEARVSFRVARTSRFRLVLQCTLAPDYGVFQISLDGKPVGNEVDLYSRRVELAPTVDLGEVSLEAGKHRLTFKLTGANKKAKKFRGKGYLLGLDYFRLTDLDPPEPKPVEKKPETESAGVLIEMPDAQRLLKKYCVRCHSGEKPKGDVSLAALSTKAALLKDAETTEQITDAIAFGSMPPEKAAQPTKGERQQLARFFNALLDEYATSSNRLPPTVMRRLTRYEYNNAVRDLLKLRGDVFPLPERTLRAYNRYYNPASGVFPDVIRVGNRTLGKNQVEKQILDGVSPFAIDLQAEHGFNNRGNQLSISPLLLETFVKLGESIVNRSQTGPADPRRHGMKQLPKKSGEFLFEIIMRRHELRSTIMTSNRPLEDWGKLIDDVPAATAILDRFLQHADLIQITGRSYRLRGRAADTKSSPEPEKPKPARPQPRNPKPAKPANRVAPGKRRKTAANRPSNLNHTGRF